MIALEVCAYSFESCWAAHQAGAQRIELCSSPYEGGTTPSLGLLQQVLDRCRPEVHVMVRPRGGDFCYNDWELDTLRAEIETFKSLNVSGLVLGVLQPNGQVDLPRLHEMVALAQPLPVTFHRAFDMTPDPKQALNDLLTAGCVRLLTSGQQNSAEAGVLLIEQLVAQAQGRLQIMAGGGINPQNLQRLLQTGIDAVHLSARAVRASAMQYRKAGVFMGGLPQVSEYEIAFSDVTRLRQVQQGIEAFVNRFS
jgi:copper homeostasis protein